MITDQCQCKHLSIVSARTNEGACESDAIIFKTPSSVYLLTNLSTPYHREVLGDARETYNKRFAIHLFSRSGVVTQRSASKVKSLHLRHVLARSSRRILLAERVRLIRAMTAATTPGGVYTLSATYIPVILEAIQKIRADEEGDFLSYSKVNADQISYSQSNRTNRRTRTTLSRYMRRRLGLSPDIFPDAVMQNFARSIFARMHDNVHDRIKIVQGQELMNAYREGLGGHTCMTGTAAIHETLLATNPSKAQLALYKLAPGRYARAILWTCDDGTKVLDRIYPNDGAHVHVFHRWASENEIAYRRLNGAATGMSRILLVPDANKEVTLNMACGTFPYMDTFRWGIPNYETNTITLTNQWNEHHLYQLNTTSGEAQKHGRFFVRCAKCQTLIQNTSRSVADVIYFDSDWNETHTDKLCLGCAEEYTTQCSWCGRRAPTASMTVEYYLGAYDCLCTQAVCSCCAEGRDYHNPKNKLISPPILSTLLGANRRYVLQGALRTETMTLKRCSICGRRWKSTSMVETGEGDFLCVQCADECPKCQRYNPKGIQTCTHCGESI